MKIKSEILAVLDDCTFEGSNLLLTEAFRHFIQVENGGTITPLPDNSFKETGTNVNTVLVSF